MANIKFTGVHKSFGSNKIITDFNLLGKEDEFLVLVGPSGCGKSTLLRMIDYSLIFLISACAAANLATGTL